MAGFLIWTSKLGVASWGTNITKLVLW
jgi:hypothetical protein